ncbi:PREDICTED: resistin [Chrysochloris asiatica]|uniref:Resistin n=1 Tax=Chrysochloris asiatica TaxID=185453 RepID=A0A9B0TRF1_CHRAS|nr:PREDICTED: resistin [Chrysochloris asiatica]
MNVVCFYLLPVLGLLVSGVSLCPVDEAINQKIQKDSSSLIRETMRGLHLDCRSVTSRGDLASCPAGFAVTSCTCGSACGSWDIRAETTCHCQCSGMDWTGARCCRRCLESLPAQCMLDINQKFPYQVLRPDLIAAHKML